MGMQELKEAFTMIDQDRDGFIGMEDLKDMFSSLGRVPPDDELNAMLKECPGQLNFTFSSHSLVKKFPVPIPRMLLGTLSPCSMKMVRDSSPKTISRICWKTWVTTSQKRRSRMYGKMLP